MSVPDIESGAVRRGATVSTSRLEAFSDGVMAVAITLLVLDIHVPAVNDHASLAHKLGQLWPNYAAYTISFITIGIIWVNHHAMIGRLREADHSILALNLLLLLSIGLLPFATALLATYLRVANGQHLAAAVYSGAYLLMAILFSVLQRHILLARPYLLSVEMPRAQRRQILARGTAGLAPYALATALAPVSAYVTLIICAAVAAFYASPMARG
jgi:uncharacterized membrane protein